MRLLEYGCNMDFKRYVDKYCEKHGNLPEEAVTHVIVQEVENCYRHKRLNIKQDM